MTRLFDYNWKLSDGYPAKGMEEHGLKVFGTFICGGGSTMGYKLAGYNHLGGVEIDKKIAKVYKTNHNPKYLYTEDIRDFINSNDLPDELYQLDILDGSPPCSTFSMAGSREKAWGKEKIFAEGQKKQRLDDLFFEYIKLAQKLQPKVAIAENVKGLILGNAKMYVSEILNRFADAGYKTQIFLLNAASMGVPQKRERVFFIARRTDLPMPDIKLKFSEKPILFGSVRSEKGKELLDGGKYKKLLEHRQENDLSIADIYNRVYGYRSGMCNKLYNDRDVAATITSSGCKFRMCDGMWLSDMDNIFCQTFPTDYNFCGVNVQYVCGMSVPPVMMAQIANQIYLQWFK